MTVVPTRVLMATSAILLGLLSGCTGSPPIGGEDPGQIEAPLDPVYLPLQELLREVPCEAASVSESATTENLLSLTDLPLASTDRVRTFGELDFDQSLFVEALYNQEGFVVVNASDPAEPVQKSTYQAKDSGSTYDVKFSADHALVYVGYKDRIELVDVRDPSMPKRVSTFMHPADYGGQAHMLGAVVLGGTEYVFAVPSISGTGVLVAKRTGENESAALELVTIYQSTVASPFLPQALAPHDVYITWDRALNATVLWAANGFNGIVALGIDDPTRPVTLAAVPAANVEGVGGPAPSYYHSIQQVWIDGKRILATAAEVGYNTVKVFDASVLDDIRLIGEWVLDENQPTNLEHNLQIVDGRLFVAHYQYGMFVFDLRSLVAAPGGPLEPVGHWQPPSGLVWDVVVRDGLLYLSGISFGLHVVGFGCFVPGETELTSTA